MSASFVAVSTFPVCLSPFAFWYFLSAMNVDDFIFPSFFPEKYHSLERNDWSARTLLLLSPMRIPENAVTEFSAFL